MIDPIGLEILIEGHSLLDVLEAIEIIFRKWLREQAREFANDDLDVVQLRKLYKAAREYALLADFNDSPI